MYNRRNALLFIVIGFAVFFASVGAHDALSRPSFLATNVRDFKSFYCAGEAVLQHADPYRVEPLRACTHRVVSWEPTWLVVPAPLPGYSLAFFAALATLPFQTASLAYEALLVAGVLIGALALARLTGWSPLLTLLVLIPTDGFLNVSYGGFMPIVVAALCVGALALERGAMTVVAICLGIAMLEPHVALPAFLAVLIGVPRARVATCAVAAVLVAISIAAVGVSINVEYFRTELPLVALGEVAANDQYSLTRVLAAIGMSPARAVSIGSASFLFMLAVGVTLGLRLAKRRRLAYLLLLPPAAGMLGGSYIHDVQLVAEIPLALLIASDVPALRGWSLGAALLLLLPALSHRFAAFPAPAIFVLAAMVSLLELFKTTAEPAWRKKTALLAQIVVVAAVGLSIVQGVHANSRIAQPIAAHAVAEPVISASEFAPQVWGDYLTSIPPEHAASRYILEKLPAWFAITILVLCALRLASVDERAVQARVRTAS
jgi:hypothetical protein